MSPTILLTETNTTNKLSPNIALSNFTLLETNPTTQEITTTLNNAAAVEWATLSYQQLTIYPTIVDLTINIAMHVNGPDIL